MVNVRFGVGVCGFWLVPDLLSFLLFTPIAKTTLFTVPCEQMFSGTKQIATDHWSVMLRYNSIRRAHHDGIYMGTGYIQCWNAMQVEEVNLLDFKEMLADDVDIVEWDKVINTDWNDFELEV